MLIVETKIFHYHKFQFIVALGIMYLGWIVLLRNKIANMTQLINFRIFMSDYTSKLMQETQETNNGTKTKS